MQVGFEGKQPETEEELESNPTINKLIRVDIKKGFKVTITAGTYSDKIDNPTSISMDTGLIKSDVESVSGISDPRDIWRG